jgi:hypothetical protein
MCKYHNYYNARAHRFKTLHLVRKLISPQAFTGSVTIPAHATATTMHFPADAGLVFLTD